MQQFSPIRHLFSLNCKLKHNPMNWPPFKEALLIK